MVLRHVVQFLNELLTPLLSELRDGNADDLAVVAWIQPEVRVPDGLLDRRNLGAVPRLNGNHERLRHVECTELIDGGRRSVIIDHYSVEYAHGRTAGAYVRKLSLEILDDTFHFGFCCTCYAVYTHKFP